MFESGLPPDLNADCAQRRNRAFGVLRTARRRWWRCCPPAGARSALMMSLHVWSMAHASPSLFGAATRTADPADDREELLGPPARLLQGLGLRKSFDEALDSVVANTQCKCR